MITTQWTGRWGDMQIDRGLHVYKLTKMCDICLHADINMYTLRKLHCTNTQACINVTYSRNRNCMDRHTLIDTHWSIICHTTVSNIFTYDFK